MINIDRTKYLSNNVVEKEQLPKILEKYRKEGKKIGLCSGSFDLLHPGHINHINSAKKLCDVLVVAVAEDKFNSTHRKEKGRPIFSHYIRTFMVGNLKAADYVFIDDGSTNTIGFIKPDFYIKGIDYANEKNPDAQQIKNLLTSFGGKIVFTYDEKFSTTEIINHIKKEID